MPGSRVDRELSDPDGSMWEMLDELALRFPERSAAEVSGALRRLVTAGGLEEAEDGQPAELTARERERYRRGRALFRRLGLAPRLTAWDAQLRLRQSRVVLVGLGGAGGTAALALAASGVGQLHCVEPDVVRLSNLNRQVLYTEEDIGHPKLEVALARLRAHNSDIAITGERTRITGPQALHDLAASADLLLLTAQAPAELSRWTNRACLTTGTPWAHGGFHGPLVEIGVYRPGASGPCHECGPDATHPDTGARAANAVSAGLTGQLLAHAALSLLTGAPTFRPNRRFCLDLRALAQREIRGRRRARRDCPACRRGRTR